MKSAPTMFVFALLGKNSTIFIIYYLFFIIYFDFTAIFAIFQAISVIFLQKITRYTIDIAGGRVPPTPTATKGANHYADECVFHRQPESRVGKAGRQAARL
ncbi:MAG: hypothetical protein MR833_05440 [Gemmiger formicilis]|jgi:hypothetical protein|uniref:hypothetical protein n=1 Tax=Gemmiger formicilis TaxID=745368 RepID=UPI0013564672|nr:hypothetical protein [Gemmiger formicilis]MBS5474497.1 hypothetical protein [Subdoligranulum variabile]MCI6356749.1 hypothetical protein [Gemmiger formicilis]MCI6896225.1 hypothetical protein [Gemmiger formicilis]MDD5841567.1 hypothetical protein [Gemmiger formicilis]MDD6426836.1 hypothetical protein [Gemmiger formicilis]